MTGFAMSFDCQNASVYHAQSSISLARRFRRELRYRPRLSPVIGSFSA